MLVVIVLLREQSEGFLGAELRYAGEVLDSKAIQNLGSLQFPRTATQRALDGRHFDLRRFASMSRYTGDSENSSGFGRNLR